ncbi:MAG: hypothetical protein IKB75_07470 [Clostridia bacterium]|nr:hypothetical protein [Clostridia bacterium]
MKDYLGKNSPIRFQFPIDGDCINKNDGEEVDGGIRIQARVEAPTGHAVTVCGLPAKESDGVYYADVTVKSLENTLTACDLTDHTECTVKVLRLPDCVVGGYRISSDDNILFLQDINEHRDVYRSIFENPHLALYKKAHELYGAKVHLNLFYELDAEARARFSPARPYFNLSMMTDQFKDEFIANSDWLKLSFHAKSEMPWRPYRDADAETVTRDCELVHREILRFAGKETLSACTTIHWGEATAESVKALRALGYRTLAGYFIPGKAPVAYYAPNDLIEHIFDRDFWYDAETDVLFGRIDRVLDNGTNEINLEILRDAIKSPTRGGYIEVMIHEQYFHKDYSRYLDDYATRVLDACRLLYENGYVGQFIGDLL